MSNGRWRMVLARCRALVDRRRRERELDEEIADHLARLAEEARAGGATDAAARAEALRRFGGVARTRETYREQLGFARLEAFWLDLRIAARALATRPLLFLAASVSIAIGVGLNLGVYAALSRVLFGTSISGAAPDDRLLAINGEISYPNYQDLAGVDAFSGVAAMQITRVAWRTDEGAVRVGAKIVSPNFFDVVAVRPAYGRTFRGEDDAHTTVLGFGFWQRRFAGDPSVIGRTLTLNGWPYVVIGVMPSDFNAPVAPMVASDIYVPIGPQVCLGLPDRAAPQFDLVARLKDGVAPAQAQAAVATAVADLERRYPRENARLATAIHTQSLAGIGFWRGMLGGAMPLALAAAATVYTIVGLVLLVGCANVAGLLLARAEERRREIAVCAALGATRWRLAQRFVAESAIIALAGSALAVLFYEAAVAAITRVAWTAASLTVTLPGLPLVYCIAVAFVVTLACALAPAFAVSRSTVAPALASGSRQATSRTRGRNLLVVAQVAICVMFLSGASVLFHDVVRMRSADPGFDTAHTVSVEVRPAPNAAGFRLRPFERVRAVVRQLPGVESISAARNVPLMFLTWRASVHVAGDNGQPRRVDVMPVGPRYFETLRIPLLRGRDLKDEDIRFQGRAATPIVVNQTLADRFFGGSDPIGRTIVLEAGGQVGADRALTIAGVARDSKVRSLDEDAHPVVYLPEIGDFLFVRVAGPASGAVRMIERAVWSAETIAWVDAQPLEAQVQFAQRPAQIGGATLAALGAIGLTMAMVGLYAVVSYGVNRRTFEIGVRLAVGAPRRSVLQMIVRDGLVVVAIGCAAGLVAAQLAIRAIAPLVTLNQGRFDPLAVGAVVVTMAIVGTAASFAPALRASRVDPVVALRHE
jgi:putative ABC transport system permease protein